MSNYEFGDMVTLTDDGGIYMVLGPYIGDRGRSDPLGPAVWIADIDTEYTRLGEGWAVWTVTSRLEPLDE